MSPRFLQGTFPGKLVQRIEPRLDTGKALMDGGGELAAYAAALKPRQIALVHGDEEARAALRVRLDRITVFLPQNGTVMTVARTNATPGKTVTEKAWPSPLPNLLGEGRALTRNDLPALWRTLSQIPALRMVTAREVAQLWYGQTREETVQSVLEVLAQDHRQHYFVPQEALREARERYIREANEIHVSLNLQR